MDNLVGRVRRCIDDYEMIQEGDVIAVGLSGGKDSAVLLWALNELRRYYPKKFGLKAVTISMGIEGMDFGPVARWCGEMGVEYVIKETELYQLIFHERREKNPCALCSKMRRGALNDAIRDMGANKLALGHHYDDAVVTFMMNLMNEGRLGCFEPMTFMSRAGVTQIRPLLYCGEGSVASMAARQGLPVVQSLCPADKNTNREEATRILRELSQSVPDIKDKIFGAMKRLPLNGWQPTGHPRGRGL